MRDDYVKFVLAAYMQSSAFDGQVGSEFIFDNNYQDLARATITTAFGNQDISVDPELYEDQFQEIFSALVDGNGVVYEGDDYTEQWFKFVQQIKNRVIGQIMGANPVSQRLQRLGAAAPEALKRALTKIVFDDSLKHGSAHDLPDLSDQLIASISIPASDRVVSLSHNQIAEAEVPVSELISALEQDNGAPDQIGLRERLLGQIKAGRELIRSGEYRAYLLYEVLVRALGELIQRYGNPTIVALANALLGAVVSLLLQVK